MKGILLSDTLTVHIHSLEYQEWIFNLAVFSYIMYLFF